MKKLLSAVVAFTIIFALSSTAYATGGYYVIKGENTYHGFLCDELEGCALENIRWYATIKEAKNAGMKPAECCKDYKWDYEDDAATYFYSKDGKIQSALDLERFRGIIDCMEDVEFQQEHYDEGYDDGYETGHDAGYDDGYRNGKEDGYKEGYDDALLKAEDMKNSAKIGAYGTSIVVALILFCLNESRRKQKRFNELIKKRQIRKNIIRISAVYGDLITKELNGTPVEITTVFSGVSDPSTVGPDRYRAWKYLAYWIAAKYAEYDYNWHTSESMRKCAEKWFGKDTVSFNKIVALDEILNRSTKYLLDSDKWPYDNKTTESFDELFDLVDMMVDSMWKENY